MLWPLVKWLATLTCLGLMCATAVADDTIVLAPRAETGPDRVDAGLYTGMAAGLPSGLEPGLGIGITHECGCKIAYATAATAPGSQATRSRPAPSLRCRPPISRA